MPIAVGEAVAVMGPSGSSKSTLPNMIAGLDRPTNGTVRLSGGQAACYLRQLVVLRLAAAGRAGRLVRFAMVGGSGVLVNLAVLASLLRVAPGAIWAGAGGRIIAAVAATQVAVGWNFALTERWVFPGRTGHWAARLLPFWVLNCGALLAQLPLAGRLQPMLSGSYVLATGAALVLLMLARFVVCDRWLYHPAGAQAAPRPATTLPRPASPWSGAGQHRHRPRPAKWKRSLDRTDRRTRSANG